MTQFVLFLWQDKLFKGGIYCMANAPPVPGIWYFEPGPAKPPLPFQDTQGTFELVAGPAMLIKSPPSEGNLLAVMWNLSLAIANSGATGAFASATITGSWQYQKVEEGIDKLAREFPELVIKR